MRERINTALKEAVKSQDKIRMSTLRLINAAIKDRDIASRTNGKSEGVGDAEVLGILAKMIKQRDESAVTYEQAGRLELSEQERNEIVVIQEFLPKQLNEDEIAAACRQVVEDLDAGGLKDMGRTMGALKERYSGQMDFGKASKTVKGLLS
ncbi:MAG: GatB/YqeY domain-containing protein [Hyphomicrobiales bacterium]